MKHEETRVPGRWQARQATASTTWGGACKTKHQINWLYDSAAAADSRATYIAAVYTRWQGCFEQHTCITRNHDYKSYYAQAQAREDTPHAACWGACLCTSKQFQIASKGCFRVSLGLEGSSLRPCASSPAGHQEARLPIS